MVNSEQMVSKYLLAQYL